MRSITLTGASQQIILPSPFVYYRGFSVKETAAATAGFVVWDSTSALGATGKILDEVNLSASESTREVWGSPKIALVGIFVQIVSGAVAGSIFFD